MVLLGRKILLIFAVALFFGAGHMAEAADTSTESDKAVALEECGACHFFYPREMLPAFSWKKIVDSLDNHFGEDASLDGESQARILTYLAAGRSLEIPMQITKTGWFKQRHGGGFEKMAGNSNIKLSNCGKCHSSMN